MIIRINDKNGNNIAECDLSHHDIGIWYTNQKSNISNVYGDIIQTEKGFDDVIDIDIDNIIPPKQIDEETKLLMKLKNSFNEEFNWTPQALDEYIGYCSTFGGDYTSYIAEAINKCFDALINNEPFCDRQGLIDEIRNKKKFNDLNNEKNKGDSNDE